MATTAACNYFHVVVVSLAFPFIHHLPFQSSIYTRSIWAINSFRLI